MALPPATALPSPASAPSHPPEAIDNSHNVLRLKIISSSHINARVSTAIAHLTTTPTAEASREPLVCLTAHATVANKLVSIVEILKRQLAADKVPIHQYNALTSTLVTLKPKTHPESHTEHGQDGETFQAMPTADKVRSMPVLSIYLCRHPVKLLEKEHGEQS